MPPTAFHEFMPSCFHSLILHTFIECSLHRPCHSSGNPENTSHPVCPQQHSPALAASPRAAFQKENPIYNSQKARRLQVASSVNIFISFKTSRVCLCLFYNKNSNLIKSTFWIYYFKLKILLALCLAVLWITRYWCWVSHTREPGFIGLAIHQESLKLLMWF